jgi:hypothetical protein
MMTMRLSFISLVVLFFCGCSNFQGAKALEFFSNIDKSGRWKPYNRVDAEGRVLSGDVACFEVNVFVLDSVKDLMVQGGSEKKCWDDHGILTEYVVKDSSGETIYSQKSETENGYLLSRTIDSKVVSRRLPKKTTLRMTTPEDEAANTRAYTLTNDSGTVFKVQYRTGENGKMVAAKIIYPFTHELNIEYGKDDSLLSISDATRAKEHHIDFISEQGSRYVEKVVYNGELYSYGSREVDAKGRPVDIVFSDEFSGGQIHRKYTYTPDGRTATIWENGVSRNLVYEGEKLVREEFYNYGGKLLMVVDIVTDSVGNVVESSYVKKADMRLNRAKKQYKYTITYR